MKKSVFAIPVKTIERSIFIIRAHKVMLDEDLATLYGVETRNLIQAVKRNIERFPHAFMFQISKEEFVSLRSQIVISKGKGGRRYPPYAFTEQGVAMLSSVLRSNRAIQVNIQIMRAFTQFRQMLSTHKDLKRKIELMEKKYDENFKIVFQAIKQMLETDEKSKKKIGFAVKEKQKAYRRKTRKK